MLSPKTQYSLKNAREYFSEHLSTGDYYSEGHTTHGEWVGQGARQLGLSAQVGQAEFLALCENLHPTTGERLTQRSLNRRLESHSDGSIHSVANRRVFYDFTISAPKSVSIAALVGGDVRITDAHNKAIRVAMDAMEPFACTRVRVGGTNTDRETGNLVTATFTHDTSRALDPHLHTHCIVFNATFDPVENQWKALQNFEMLRAQKYVENVYYHELARSLVGLGYGFENRSRGDFDVSGISRALCERFSKRHSEIDAQTRTLLEQHPEKASGNIADIRENLAQNRRSRKVRDLKLDQLKGIWKNQITESEAEALAVINAAHPKPGGSFTHTASSALDLAEAHIFERHSVVAEHELWRRALEFGRGGDFEIEQLKAASRARNYVRDQAKPGKLTTRKALAVEQEIVRLAASGVGRHPPFNTKHIPSDKLAPDQARVVSQLLGSRDFLTLFRGAAGTGKSFALMEVFEGLKNTERSIHVLAPQRQQALDLSAAGLSDATTLSEFLARKPATKGDVIILDEAGQIGGEQMCALLSYAETSGCRIICSGDTRQHGAVEASDALRAIERHSGLSAAELTRIRRQDPAHAKTETERVFIQGYRAAVEAASQGDAALSFQMLERIGAVVPCVPGTQHETLASEFVQHVSKAESVLVVAQTWAEIHRLNTCIRTALKTANLLPMEESVVKPLEVTDLSGVQKGDPRFYDADTVVIFNRNLSGFRKNQTGRVTGFLPNSLLVECENRIREIPFSKLDHLVVCKEREMTVSSGDRLQLKANGRTREGRRLTNGELVTVSTIEPNGRIHLADGRVLGSEFRRFVRGYAVTSYGSQGKTVDHVLFSDSAVRAATSQQQWYVTISRGRKSVRIFTEDREALAENVVRSGNRELALDLVGIQTPASQGMRPQQTRARRLLERLRRFVGQKAASQRVGSTIQRNQAP
jgi:conjugative relaxase-like TrwC/TraI family protein